LYHAPLLPRTVSILIALLAPFPAAAADSALLAAVKKSDATAVRALLAEKADVNAADADGATPLHWAVHNDDIGIAELLLRAGARVAAANAYDVTPLTLASINGSPRMIEMLLASGADPNTALPEGETALMTAARTGRAAAVSVLLSHGADVNAKERWRGQTALMWAAAQKHTDVVRLLIEHGADVEARSKNGFTPLLFAVRAGDAQTAFVLLDAGANVNQAAPDGTSLLATAIVNAHFELAVSLLDRGANPAAGGPGQSALHVAVRARNPDTVTLPNPPPTGRLDSLDLIKALLAHGADPNARLTQAPSAGNTLMNTVGATPFLLAARAVDVPLMRLLVAAGADPLVPTRDGATPLMAAAGLGFEEGRQTAWSEPAALAAVTLAWQLGGDVNAMDAARNTALHGAAMTGANTVVEFLASKGARLGVTNTRGWTPAAIADGVRIGARLVTHPDTASLFRRLMSGGRP
jgi:ankyrin repeat protein